MATAFSETTPSCCHMCRCADDSQTLARYTLQTIKHTLCNGCARRSQRNILIAEDLNVRWTCQKHTSRRAEIFCKNHQTAICHICATTSHKTCDTQDAEDTVNERKQKLLQLVDQMKQLAESKAPIKRIVAVASMHLDNVQKKLREASEEALDVFEKERKTISELINKEADDEIEKINIRREQRLKENLTIIEQGRQLIFKRRCILLDELRLLDGKLQEHATTGVDSQSSAITKSLMKAHTLLDDEGMMLTHFFEVESDMVRNLQADYAKNDAQLITQGAQKIDFKRESGLHFGKLQGIDGTWTLVTTLSMELCQPSLIGSTDKNSVIAIDKKTQSIVLVNHQKQATHQLTGGAMWQNIYRLALLDDERVVCGTTDGSLVIYRNRTWDLIKKLPLHLGAPVVLAIDHVSREQRILVVAQGKCNINIIRFVESKVVTSSVVVKDKPIIDIVVLCHGQIVIRTRCDYGDDIVVLDPEDFSVASVTHFHDRFIRSIAADQGRDALYVRNWDPRRLICSIDELRLLDGKLISVGSIVQFSALKNKWPLISADCYAPEPGKLVLLHGRQILVYIKKLLSPGVDHERQLVLTS